MYTGSTLTGFGRRLLLVVVLAIIVAGVALALAAATGHYTAVPHAATAIEYAL